MDAAAAYIRGIQDDSWNPLLGTPPPTQRCRKSALLCIVGALFLVLAVTPWPYQAAWGLATSAATFREALKAGWRLRPLPDFEQHSGAPLRHPAAAAAAAAAAAESKGGTLDWRCLVPLGGGDTRAGHGDFPVAETSGHACVHSIAAYLEVQYDADVETAISTARTWFAKSAAAALGLPDRSQVVVFDIDETALCNIKNSSVDWAQPSGQQRLASLRNQQLRGESPPILPSLAFYRRLWHAGYSLTFLTGRSEEARNATRHNLESAGYGRRCSPGALQGEEPCYVQLDMRKPEDAGTSASVYKGGRRQRLVKEGNFKIAGSFGDQFSDLSGIAPAAASFKLPNPVYYII